MGEGPDVGGSAVGSQDADRGRRGWAPAVLRNRSFRNLLFASATSSIGDWIGLFALIALAETLAGTSRAGALAVSFVMIARIVPTLVIAPIAGVFVDRWDRKRTMLVTDFIRGAIMLLVAFAGDAFQLVIATFVIEVAAALFIPAKDATVPTIVRTSRLVQANQLSLLSTYSTLPIGALLAAVVIGITERVSTGSNTLIERFPDAMAFLAERPEAVPIILNAVSFFASMVFIQRMRVPEGNRQARTDREHAPNALREMKDGLDFIAGMPLIRALVVGIMAAFLAAGAVIGVGKFFATITNSGEAGFSLLGFIVGSGLVAGIVTAGPLAARIAKERLFAPGIGIAGIALVVTALTPTLGYAALPAFVMGWGAGIAFILGYTMLQEYSEDELRGRIFATFNTAVRASLFAALVLGPLTITVLGVERTQAQIDAGASVDFEDIEQGEAEGRYPYQIGGIRMTLIGAGLIAFAGSVWTGASIATVLRRRERGDDLHTLVERGEEAPVGPGDTDLRGVLLVFEGGDGAGKSTQVAMLRDALVREGVDVVVTREPGGTPTGEALREVVLDADGDVDPRAEALLYAAARAQHVVDVLRPGVEAGAVVLCDRYVDSSIAYQGVGRDLGAGIIADLNAWATDGLLPDLTILLDVDVEAGLGRLEGGTGPDRLEAAGEDFHREVNEAFRTRAARAPERYLVVDAHQPAADVHTLVLAHVWDLLRRHGITPAESVDPVAADRRDDDATESSPELFPPGTLVIDEPPATHDPVEGHGAGPWVATQPLSDVASVAASAEQDAAVGEDPPSVRWPRPQEQAPVDTTAEEDAASEDPATEDATSEDPASEDPATEDASADQQAPAWLSLPGEEDGVWQVEPGRTP